MAPVFNETCPEKQMVTCQSPFVGFGQKLRWSNHPTPTNPELTYVKCKEPKKTHADALGKELVSSGLIGIFSIKRYRPGFVFSQMMTPPQKVSVPGSLANNTKSLKSKLFDYTRVQTKKGKGNTNYNHSSPKDISPQKSSASYHFQATISRTKNSCWTYFFSPSFCRNTFLRPSRWSIDPTPSLCRKTWSKRPWKTTGTCTTLNAWCWAKQPFWKCWALDDLIHH